VSEPPEGWPEPAETVERPPDERQRVVFEESAATRGPRRWDDLAGWLLAALFLAAAIIFLFLWLDNRDRSSAVATARVPNLVGESEARAQADAQAAGFSLTTVSRPAGDSAGTVLDQAPQAGAALERNATVIAVVSAGKGAVTVPDLTGMTVKAAIAALDAVELRPIVQRRRSGKPAGTVISQSPASGEHVAKGATVALTVAQGGGAAGSGPVSVPSLVGTTAADAIAALQQAGLVPDLRQARASAPQGTVAAQNPAPGTHAKRGDTVRLTVSAGPGTQTVTASSPSVSVRTVTVSRTRTVTTTETVTTVQTVTQPPP